MVIALWKASRSLDRTSGVAPPDVSPYFSWVSGRGWTIVAVVAVLAVAGAGLWLMLSILDPGYG